MPIRDPDVLACAAVIPSLLDLNLLQKGLPHNRRSPGTRVELSARGR
ncbi:MAG: hypothetical protein ACREE4_01155 [Stellaceae bacterium]